MGLLGRTNMKVKDMTNVLCYFKIGVYKSGSILIEQLFWNDLPTWIRSKYDWYFHYRAALLRIKYPKYRHVVDYGTYQKKTKDIIKIKEIQLNKAITRVATYERNLELYRQSYSALFPIAGEPQYHIVRNTCSFIAQCVRDDKNAFLEMLKFQKKWRDRINILMREEL